MRGHCPIVRYTVADVVRLIRSGEASLLKLRDGHAEVLMGSDILRNKANQYAVGWLSAKQVQQVETILTNPK